MVLRPRGRGRVGRRRHLIRNAPLQTQRGVSFFRPRDRSPRLRTPRSRGLRARPSLAFTPDMTLSRVALASAGATAAAAAVLIRGEQIRRATERFAAAALETLLNAVDANDPETGAHVRRVAAYALIIGEAADLSDHECKSIERVALFHDIGKIHEALIDIVRDDQPLSPADRRAIATHPAVGAKVLEPLSVFYPDLADGVLSHHE